MKNPLERFFTPKQVTPEQAEKMVAKVMAKELSKFGANYPGIHSAYRAATELNTQKKLGLTRNHILNILRDEALSARTPGVDDMMFGSHDEHLELINNEIENIRKEEQDKPQTPNGQ